MYLNLRDKGTSDKLKFLQVPFFQIISGLFENTSAKLIVKAEYRGSRISHIHFELGTDEPHL